MGGWGSGLRGTLRLREVSEHWDGVKVIGREKNDKELGIRTQMRAVIQGIKEQISWGCDCSWNVSISSVMRPRVKIFIQLGAKLLMKGELVIKFTCLMY